MTTPLTPELLARAPKALLHDHLDGGVRPATVVELAREYGYQGLPTTDVDDLAHWFNRGAKRNDLVLYLETFAHTIGVMQHKDAVERVAFECAQDLSADGVVYAEVRMAPELCTEEGLTLDEVMQAILDGFARGSAGTDLTIYAIATAMRTAARSLEIAELAVRCRDDGVVGFDIAGAEAGYPPTRHLDAFQYVSGRTSTPRSTPARRSGCRASGRPCSGAGPSGSVTGSASSTTSPGRQGPRSLGRLAAYVRDTRIPFELCPTSNVNTGVCASIGDHPIGMLAPPALPRHPQHRQPLDERHVDDQRDDQMVDGSGGVSTTSSGSRSTA